MPRRKSGLDIHGILLLDKPAGRSSNHAMQDVRRLFNARKAGHTGNLDPFATGMLPICFGEATKTSAHMLNADKTYVATAELGVATETGDIEGAVKNRAPVPALATSDIEAALAAFVGEIRQIPPMHSALKHEGQPLYKLAREGKTIERPPRTVMIRALKLEAWEPPMLTFRVECSKGTYVRTLAEDIAERLGSCAHLKSLRRMSVSPFNAGQMVTREAIQLAVEEGLHLDLLLPIDAGLHDWGRVVIPLSQEGRFCNGNPVTVNEQAPGKVRVYSTAGDILGLGEVSATGQLQPKRVFPGLRSG